MVDQGFLSKAEENANLTRRSFLKWNAALGGVAALATGGVTASRMASTASAAEAETIIPTSCAHNCGGRCRILVHVKDGVITRLTTDDRPDTIEDPQLRACQRGRSYRHRVYHADRLKYPMKRVGKRGEGKFERISWDEATTTVAEAMQRIKDEYGPEAFINHYASGADGMQGSGTSQRLLNLFGGTLNEYGSYSAACWEFMLPRVLGSFVTANSRDDWKNSRLMVLFGFNPMEMVAGTNTMYFLKEAKKSGTKVIVIDPRQSMTAVWADEWIPIRPGTDPALIAALAYVMISEDLQDQDFLDKYTSGFDEKHMPEGIPSGNSYKSYVMGDKDDTPKTPEWAEAITGVSRERIVRLAREIALTKPTAIYQGWGGQRRAYGEEFVHAGITLAAMIGSIGIPGGSCGTGAASARYIPTGSFPGVANPVSTSISTFTWTDAIVRGTEMGAADGVIGLPDGQETLPYNIKFIYSNGGNALINQHGDINRTREILADESLVEFIVVQDQFLTPSAKFADIILPATTWMETESMTTNWMMGDTIYYMNKAIEPLFEAMPDYEICAMIADKLGLGDQYRDGKESHEDWIREWTAGVKDMDPTFDFDTFKANGLHVIYYDEPTIGLADFRADPEANPLPTASGKVEIFCQAKWDANNPEEIPGVAAYVPEWEGPDAEPELLAKYPLQLQGHHYHRRSHSTYHNVDWLAESMPQRLFMNPIDADARGIKDGDTVRIFNDRGEVKIPVRVTRRIIPGVLDLPQGAWYDPDDKGVDHAGCINVLTSHHPTPFAKGTSQHTNLVEVEKA
ncbi:MAG TPA: molybdopterin-dependent oxidoreductase [Aggregatilinea sp.]|jgi:anaerobic dimethyl sulfoxide reductase subunit A|uniref:DMSO/selenate family reductase complex A subunit n=1 Tax=Aggregatilinea sp. TaxID=2806333 RepID=UPI002D014B25|nr:DMSO/selenate family reductase complex A subunit [Aggregatilinea sp.]HML20886.1 molybdopterin-dependent oxidoreductase [Aggregatilinea sp.]